MNHDYSAFTPCTFYFGDDPTFEGFTDGTTWNGFDNIWVTPEVHEKVLAHFNAIYDPSEHGLNEVQIDGSGLYSYANGFATSVEEAA